MKSGKGAMEGRRGREGKELKDVGEMERGNKMKLACKGVWKTQKNDTTERDVQVGNKQGRPKRRKLMIWAYLGCE